MFNFFKREPTQAEILLAFLTLEIKENNRQVYIKEPRVSGYQELIKTSCGIKVTTKAGLCGSPWKNTCINGLRVSNRKIKTLIALHKHIQQVGHQEANLKDNDALIQELIAHRNQKRLK